MFHAMKKAAALLVLATALVLERAREEAEREAEQVSLRGHWRRMGPPIGRAAGLAARGRRSFHNKSGGARLTYLTDYTDGSWTLDRASEASHYDPRTGEFASTYGDETYGAQLLGDLHDPSAGSWVATGTPDVVTGLADHEGGTTGFSLTDNDTVYERVSQTISGVVAGDRHRGFKLVVYLKQDLAATHIPEFSLDPNDQAALRFQVRPTDGAVSVRNAPAADEPWSYSVTDVGGWYRIEIRRYLNGGATTSVLLQISPAQASSLGTTSSSAQGTTTYAFGSDGGVFLSTADVAWLHDGIPRVFSDGAVLIEGARTNEITTSAEMDTATYWANAGLSSTVTANQATAPDGALTAERVEITDGSGGYTRFLSGSSASGDVFSQFMRAVSGSSPYRTQAGSTGTASGTLSEAWERVSYVHGGATGAHTPVWETDAPAGDIDLYIAHLQKEIGAYPSSPIRTSGATATRLGERLQRTIDADLAAMLRSPDGFWFDYWPTFARDDVAVSNATVFDIGANGLRVHRLGTGGSDFVLVSESVNVIVLGATSINWSAGDQLRFHVVAPVVGAWSLTVENLTAGGTATGSATPTAIAVLEGETLTVGNYPTGSFHADGVISRFWLDRGADLEDLAAPFIIPSELTFTRASEAANFDPRTGQFVEATEAANWLGNDTPRIFSDGAILVEGARTNLVAASSPSPATWTNPTKISTHADPAPDGSACPVLTDDNTGGYDTFDAPTITVTATGAHTLAFYVGKKASMGSDGFPQVRLEELTADIGANLNAKLHPTTGALTVTGSATWSTVEDVGDFWLVRVGFSVVTIGDLRLRIYPAIDVTYGGGASVAVTGAIRFWGASVEADAYPNSPIRTSGATATRVAEFPRTTVTAGIEYCLKHPDGWEFPVYTNQPGTWSGNRIFIEAGNALLRVWINGAGGGTNLTVSGGATPGIIMTSGVLAFDAGDEFLISLKTPATGTWAIRVRNVTKGTEVNGSGAAPTAPTLYGETIALGCGRTGLSVQSAVYGAVRRGWTP